MALDVSLTDVPSTDGSTQTRSVTASVTAADQPANTTVTFLLDGSRDGDFREVRSKAERLRASERKSFTFEAFVGAKPPYDVRITASASLPSGDVTAQATRTVGSVPSDTEPESVDGEQRDPPETAAELLDRSRDATLEATEVTPRVGPVEPITMTASFQLPWSNQTSQTECGRTIQNQNGDMDYRITIEGVLTKSQLDRLNRLRRESEKVPVRHAAFEQSVTDVAFDQLNVERVDDNAEIEVNGRVEPCYEFQLQTKENETDETETVGDSVIDAQAFEEDP
jgi:hypothetical protein